MDPPGSDLDKDDELFGYSSDPPRRTIYSQTSSNVTMEDANRETILSNVSLENVTQETSLIDLTNGHVCEMTEYDTSASMEIAQVPTIIRSILKCIKDMFGLTKYP